MGTVILSSLAFYSLLRIAANAWHNHEQRKFEREIAARIHETEMLEERNLQIYYFEIRLINQFGYKIKSCMPDRKEMLYSDKPIEAKEWVNIDKLVNLN